MFFFLHRKVKLSNFHCCSYFGPLVCFGSVTGMDLRLLLLLAPKVSIGVSPPKCIITLSAPVAINLNVKLDTPQYFCCCNIYKLSFGFSHLHTCVRG